MSIALAARIHTHTHALASMCLCRSVATHWHSAALQTRAASLLWSNFWRAWVCVCCFWGFGKHPPALCMCARIWTVFALSFVRLAMCVARVCCQQAYVCVCFYACACICVPGWRYHCADGNASGSSSSSSASNSASYAPAMETPTANRNRQLK